MKKLILTAAMSCFAVTLLTAGIMPTDRTAHPLYLDNHLLGNAVTIRGVLAISLDDLATAICGTPNPAKAGLVVRGNHLAVAPALQASASSDTFTFSAPNKSSNTKGRVNLSNFVVMKRTDAASPMLIENGRAFVPVSDIAQLAGTTFTGNASTPGAIHLTSMPSRAAIVAAH